MRSPYCIGLCRCEEGVWYLCQVTAFEDRKWASILFLPVIHFCIYLLVIWSVERHFIFVYKIGSYRACSTIFTGLFWVLNKKVDLNVSCKTAISHKTQEVSIITGEWGWAGPTLNVGFQSENQCDWLGGPGWICSHVGFPCSAVGPGKGQPWDLEGEVEQVMVSEAPTEGGPLCVRRSPNQGLSLLFLSLERGVHVTSEHLVQTYASWVWNSLLGWLALEHIPPGFPGVPACVRPQSNRNPPTIQRGDAFSPRPSAPFSGNAVQRLCCIIISSETFAYIPG